MRIFHLSDLHVGKVVNGYDMSDGQQYAFNQIVDYAREYKPDAVIIAGDVYDRAVPSAVAMGIFSDFLDRLEDECANIMIIAGNHDSGERLDQHKNILAKQHVYYKGSYGDGPDKVTIMDQHGPVNFYLVPFIRPSDIDAEGITKNTEMMKHVVELMKLDTEERNVAVAHQMVLNGKDEPERSDSEQKEVSVGTVEHMSSYVFDDFDYVALGHIHKPQKVGREEVYYCGTPVIYSMSEKDQEKSVAMVDFGPKGDVKRTLLPLEQLHTWTDLEGTLEEVMAQGSSQDYVRITLKDNPPISTAKDILDTSFTNIMSWSNEYSAANAVSDSMQMSELNQLSVSQIVARFYEERAGVAMDDVDMEYINEIIKEFQDRDTE